MKICFNVCNTKVQGDSNPHVGSPAYATVHHHHHQGSTNWIILKQDVHSINRNLHKTCPSPFCPVYIYANSKFSVDFIIPM